MRAGKRKQAKSGSTRRYRLGLFLALVLLMLGLSGLVIDKGPWKGLPHLNFAMGSAINGDEAQQLYKEAGDALVASQFQKASSDYDKINGHYAVLRPLILIHAAKAHSQLGDESTAQQFLSTVTEDYANTPFAWMANYELGQSAVRAKDEKLAKQAFQKVIQAAPDSNIALGSHYYLGELAYQQRHYPQAVSHWRKYMDSVPNGTFSTTIVKEFLKAPIAKTAYDKQLIGLSYFAQNEYPQALPYLKAAPLNKVWLALAQTDIKRGQPRQAGQVLAQGLIVNPHTTGADERAQQGITLLMNLPGNSTPAQSKSLLEQLHQKKLHDGDDFILWQLMTLSSQQENEAERNQWAEALLTTYPHSRWAPETSWQQLWADYTADRNEAFLTRAEKHLSTYPNSNAAPRVLFWKAKLFLAQNKPDIANDLLKTLVEKYPHQYYSFRAAQILAHNNDPWHTSPHTPMPKPVDLADKASQLGKYTPEASLKPVFTELIRINSPADTLAILQALSQKPDQLPALAPLTSVAQYQQHDYADSIRVLKDALDNARRNGHPINEPAFLPLLYPVPYADLIQPAASANHLDPVLVLSLMRQESYFNPLAVSSSRAIGLMQLLPSTAAYITTWDHSGKSAAAFSPASLFSPSTNIQLGTRYLRYLHEKFDGNSMAAVGSYNGGPNAMARWIKADPHFKTDPDQFIESIPYGQSRDYIKAVFAHYWNYLP